MGKNFSLFGLTPARLLVHLSVLFLVVVWTLPTLGLFVSSFRGQGPARRVRLVDCSRHYRTQ